MMAGKKNGERWCVILLQFCRVWWGRTKYFKKLMTIILTSYAQPQTRTAPAYKEKRLSSNYLHTKGFKENKSIFNYWNLNSPCCQTDQYFVLHLTIDVYSNPQSENLSILANWCSLNLGTLVRATNLGFQHQNSRLEVQTSKLPYRDHRGSMTLVCTKSCLQSSRIGDLGKWCHSPT